ncbi:Vi polysaccharide biosynthesis UDP-N-acetylglucosamine C-6 dehydrogenase TviB [Caulobacter sp. 17J80-11]|uniref:Vi polysaccharide biosynthesis UDP-N-acetylglucosamine C-6 dehydrogenase TviB n=1 Tax=Caulobacter sp. 17J80-11 TaxID=2763502 RepID=UPI001653C926|nr:Vi polysaccharide biosynthesis UDP-N-acetylglucosamine C-6 dehydrogenase TviB [Caulobacter sp. 17J80-11]MBC6980480.1 Vi polysaccharide biosynthesis UDP-N-acetylglucosamine C-6 dehydrogenase TviB [Caulobacter sp. 17J80-11]
MHSIDSAHLGVVGLGYVGLPLALAFGRRFLTVGFDIDAGRIAELKAGADRTRESEPEDFVRAEQLSFTHKLEELAGCNTFVVTVPTPIDEAKRPDFGPLVAASRSVGSVLKRGDVVIFESTVYPGATEEVCAPILEKVSGLTFNRDFFCGYSPERINPGDKAHRLTDIVKVTSGSTPEIADYVDALYAAIVSAGTHKASSIRVAEAAKVIENTQRDLNIALVNELAMIFNRLGIDTHEVLAAAGTKWNFLPFRPGLVGGHCIGVDPYYLTHKAVEIGHHPEVILAGRRINDGMGAYVADQVLRLMATNRINPVGAKVLVLGLAFKEGCPDIRNTRVVDVVRQLQRFNAEVDIWDPWVSPEDARHEYGFGLVEQPKEGAYDAIVLAVGHPEFVALGHEGLRRLGNGPHVIYDVKSVLSQAGVDARL